MFKRNYNPITKAALSGVNELTFENIVDSLLVTSQKAPHCQQLFPSLKLTMWEIISQRPVLKDPVLSIDDITLMSTSIETFFQNMDLIRKNIQTIETITRGQSSNEIWFDFGVITASKIHEVKTKMKKVDKCYPEGNNTNLWNLIQKVAGLTFVSPNIPALKYGRAMENVAADKLIEVLNISHSKVDFQNCGLFLHEIHPFIGSCHGKFCVWR